MRNIEVIRRNMEKDYQSLIKNANELLTATSENIEEQSRLSRFKARERMEALKQQYQGLGERVRPGLQRTNETIRDHPYWTAAGAITSAGLAAVSFLMMRKRR